MGEICGTVIYEYRILVISSAVIRTRLESWAFQRGSPFLNVGNFGS